MKKFDNLESYIKKNLADYKQAPPEKSWELIRTHIPSSTWNGGKIKNILLSSLAGLFVLSTIYFYSQTVKLENRIGLLENSTNNIGASNHTINPQIGQNESQLSENLITNSANSEQQISNTKSINQASTINTQVRSQIKKYNTTITSSDFNGNRFTADNNLLSSTRISSEANSSIVIGSTSEQLNDIKNSTSSTEVPVINNGGQNYPSYSVESDNYKSVNNESNLSNQIQFLPLIAPVLELNQPNRIFEINNSILPNIRSSRISTQKEKVNLQHGIAISSGIVQSKLKPNKEGPMKPGRNFVNERNQFGKDFNISYVLKYPLKRNQFLNIGLEYNQSVFSSIQILRFRYRDFEKQDQNGRVNYNYNSGIANVNIDLRSVNSGNEPVKDLDLVGLQVELKHKKRYIFMPITYQIDKMKSEWGYGFMVGLRPGVKISNEINIENVNILHDKLICDRNKTMITRNANQKVSFVSEAYLSPHIRLDWNKNHNILLQPYFSIPFIKSNQESGRLVQTLKYGFQISLNSKF